MKKTNIYEELEVELYNEAIASEEINKQSVHYISGYI